jgi:uncharacterized protein
MSGPKGDKKRGIPLGLVGIGIAVLAVLAVAGVLVLSSLGALGDDEKSGAAAVAELPTDPEELADQLQVVWRMAFDKEGKDYSDARIADATAATGNCKEIATSEIAFYCVTDSTIYLDDAFLAALRDTGDLAQPYALAHLFGRHVQNELGIWDKAVGQELDDPTQIPLVTRQLELEADCLAGFGLAALAGQGELTSESFADPIAAIEDEARPRTEALSGLLNPETWNNGPLADQLEWLDRGLGIADVGSCDTFGGAVTDVPPR